MLRANIAAAAAAAANGLVMMDDADADDDDDDDDVGTIFLEVWKRQRSTLAYEWDVSSFENSEPDRPQFVGTVSVPVRSTQHFYSRRLFCCYSRSILK